MDRHVILTLGRSGSNTLQNMLNQSPHILNLGEVLGEWNTIRKLHRRLPFLARTDEAYLDWVLMSDRFARRVNAFRSARKLLAGKRAEVKDFTQVTTYGIKDFSLNFHRFGVADYLEKRPTIKVIGLIREGAVERMLSNAMLASTGVVAVKQDTKTSAARLTLDPAQVATMLTEIENEDACLNRMLAALPQTRVHIVRYHDLFSDPAGQQAVMAGIFGFLGVPAIRTEARMSKIIRQPISEVIANYDDCLAAVRGTPHEQALRDADTRV